MARRKPEPGHNSAAAAELLAFVERIERVLAEIDDLKSDLRDIKTEAKGRGYDIKAVMKIVSERRETAEQKRARRETEEITDVYRAALGMLDGTPLGEAARQRLMPDQQEQDQAEPEAPQPTPTTIGPEDVAAARQAGREAMRAGARIIDNPYLAGDPRRAAWDEGWCAEAGSDGMDLPEAWRRRPKPKKPDGEDDGGDGADAGGEA